MHVITIGSIILAINSQVVAIKYILLFNRMEKIIDYINVKMYKNKYYKYKQKYLQLKYQIGGLFEDYSINTLDKMQLHRFIVNKNSNLLEIIDNNFNNKYEFNLLNNDFFILFDNILKQFYAFNKKGDEITIDTPDYKYIIDIFSKINKRTNLLQLGIKYLILTQITCCYNPINLPEIKDFIILLNEKISIKCPELKLIIDNYSKLTGYVTIFSRKDYLTLCLYHNNNCISSISLKIEDTTAIIESTTHKEYENRKFNKLLRCITIIICDKIICKVGKKLKTIISTPTNPISSWLLISNFESHVYNIENQMNTQHQIINPLLPYNNSNHSNNNNNSNNSNHNNHNNYCNYNNHRKISNRDELSSLLA